MSPSMILQIWGVRGSIPTPGPQTARYGGNTSCVSIQLGDALLVLDAGTGIRPLGEAHANWPGEIVIALTHLHWDHVQGFPFFAPLFQPHRHIALLTPHKRDRSLGRIVGLDGVHFPLKPGHLPSKLAINDRYGETILRKNNASLRKIQVNHPGGCLGYRVERGGRSIVFIPDNELDPPYARAVETADLVEFCRGADLLIHDAQYLPHELPEKRGWGHSLVTQACDLAHAAQAHRLLLTHHDPARVDATVDGIQTIAREHLRSIGSSVVCEAASEGTCIALDTCPIQTIDDICQPL